MNNTTVKEVITRDLVNAAMTYEEYRNMIDDLMSSGKTTGENHSEAMLHYTKMNVHRMKRHDKRTELSDDMKETLSRIERPQVWLVLTEAWCGDAAQSVPVMNQMAEQNENIQLKLILRDENLDVMDQFLQRGKSRSIPKLIILDAGTLDVLGHWGPRPEESQELYDTLRSSNEMAYQEVAEHLHKWYADNKSEAIQSEISGVLQDILN
ncbi:MAG: thioredoxin family protein [Balneolaceae bacterium]